MIESSVCSRFSCLKCLAVGIGAISLGWCQHEIDLCVIFYVILSVDQIYQNVEGTLSVGNIYISCVYLKSQHNLRKVYLL